MKVNLMELSDLIGLLISVIETEEGLRERLESCGFDVEVKLVRCKKIRDAVLDLIKPWREEL